MDKVKRSKPERYYGNVENKECGLKLKVQTFFKKAIFKTSFFSKKLKKK